MGRGINFQGDSVCATHGPQVFAAFGNTALTIIRRLGYKEVESFEHFAEHRQAAIAAVRGQRTE